jgi:glycosyltransferase involved in cell wall biosynthesis
MPELSIIMPCFNEEASLPMAVDKLNDVITHNSLDSELIILDDESQDATLQVAADLIATYPALRIRVFHRIRHRRGYGAVVRFGMAYATGRYCCFVSADGLDPVELIPEFVKRLRAGVHHVQVSRYIRPEDQCNVEWKFRVYQRIYRALTRILLGQLITDSTYGFRAFHRAYMMALGTSSNRFNICPEITFKMLLSGARMEFIPGQPYPYIGGGSTKFRLPAETLGYAYVLLRAWLHRLKLYWF